MLLFTWPVQIALITTGVFAFIPYYPTYRCIEDGKCIGSESKRDTNRVNVHSHTLKIKQRMPRDDLPHNIRIDRYLARLTKKFSHSGDSIAKRSNAYPIVTAAPPTQTNSAALDQDGTDYSYFAEVNFGSDATPLYMLMDTGASASWVMGTSCESPACLAHNTFGPTNSKTYNATTGTFDIAYGTGHVSGAVASDTVSFAGFTLPLTFGVANSTSDDFLHFPFDGIMGLARDPGSYPTILQTISAAKLLKSNVFGVNLDRDSDGIHNGEINFGAPDTSKYSGSLSYTALSSSGGDWVIAADGVGVEGKSAGITGRSAYIDTGTSYIFIPPDDAKALHGLIPGSQLSSDGNTWFVPCTTTSSVQFTFSGVSYSVASEDWIGGKSGGTLCTSNIFPGTPVGANNWLLGDTFIKNVYTVFDSDQSRIGFGIKTTVSPSSTSTESSSVSTASSSLTSDAGPMTSNAISTVASSINGSSMTPNSSSIAHAPSETGAPGSTGSSGFDAAITSSSMSAAAATVASSSPSPSPTTPAHGSTASRFEHLTILMAAIVLATVALVS